jgi:hypothetical protein
MSGVDLYEQLSPEQRERIVFATGGAFTARAQSFLAKVPNHTIDKPFDPKVVRKIVADLEVSSNSSEKGGT